MKVLFIYPDIALYSRRYQQGVGYLSAVLKKAGHTTSLLHLEKDVSSKWLLAQVERFAPDLVGISIITHQFAYARKYAGWIKTAFPGIPIICGGVHPTLWPQEVISESGIDIICLGEGEGPLLELVTRLEARIDFQDVPGLWVKQGGEIIRNPRPPLLQDLDQLPFPDREVFDFPRILRRWSGVADVISGRGCPYNCTYCCSPSLRKLSSGLGKFIRRRSVARVIQEIHELASRYPVKKINFDDDTFALDLNWIQEFRKYYPREIGLPFTCNARVEPLNRDMLSELKEAGCDTLYIGVESGSERLRREVLHRNMTNEHIATVFATAHKMGLKTFAYNMIGFPFETPELAEETVALNRKINPTKIQISTLYPYPGTELYRLCQEHGFLTPESKDSYFSEGSVLRLPSFSNEQIIHYHQVMWDLKLKKEIETRRFLRPIFTALKVVLGEHLTLRLGNWVRRRMPDLEWFLRKIS